jgi:trans-aconitate 2-methyltransferase
MVDWSARQYAKFEDERTRPVRDLLAAVPDSPIRGNGGGRRAVDLGCGPGNSTEVLAARLPGAEIVGLDSSPDMVAAARQRLPGVPFRIARIEEWDDPGPWDVILANAVLQWLPRHDALLPRLAGRLAPGGSLAVQMPDNLDEPSHALMREVAAAGSWRGKLGGAAETRAAVATPAWYHGMLRPCCAQVDVWRTTYHHVLPGAAGVVEWFKGSGLCPFLAPLDEAEKADFLARYEDAVARAYPALADGTVLLPFPRLFLVATR